MKPKFLKLCSLLASASFLLSACGGTPAEPAAATDIPAAQAEGEVLAEGRIVPRQSVELAFASNGQLAEVLAQEDATVKAGDVIGRLGDRESLESRVAAAELELLSAQQELLTAKQALQNLADDLPKAQNQALQALTDAQKALRDAERTANGLNAPAGQTDIDAALAAMVMARNRLDKARDDYEPYENKSVDNLARASFLGRLADAQRLYDNAVRKYNNMRGITGTDFDVAQAEAKLSIAQASLEQVQKEYDMLAKGPDPDEVALAQSRVETAQGRIDAAEAAQAEAQKALDNLELVATIDGTVVKNDLIVGQQVSANSPVVQLADFSQWYVETDDLTELDVASIAPGQKVNLAFDALPDLKLTGTVESISNVFEEKRGDITYTVRIALDESDPRIRWGMTVTTTFQE